MIYVYASTCGFVEEQARAIAQRADRTPCPRCDGLLLRDFAREVNTITINAVPMSFFVQWGDVYDISPREMARRKDIERYDPSIPHKPEIPRTHFDVPRGIDDIDTLVKHLAPVDGQHETDKLLARVAPLPEER